MTMPTFTEPAPTLEDVWRLFRETDRKFQETDLKFQETDRKIQENSAQLKEIERLIKESSQETDRKFQETERLLKESSQKTDQKLNQLEKLFTSQWGRLIESLVEGALVRVFNERGILVTRTITRMKGNYQGQNYELDIIVINGEDIIVVEVKTTLRPKYVTHFLNKLDQAKLWMPEYANKQIYGAMAFLQADAGSEDMVIKRGMFAIHATGANAYIINAKDFVPRAF